jgi:hypothetical protein
MVAWLLLFDQAAVSLHITCLHVQACFAVEYAQQQAQTLVGIFELL